VKAKSLTIEIEMGPGDIDVRYLGQVETKGFQDPFAIRQDAPSAQLGSWMAIFFKDEGAGEQMWGEPGKVEGG
jgi:hypothetical protein